jgi:hypothetical protein
MIRREWMEYVGQWIECVGRLNPLVGQRAYIYGLRSYGHGEALLDEIFFGKDGPRVTYGGFMDMRDFIIYIPTKDDCERAVMAVFGDKR